MIRSGLQVPEGFQARTDVCVIGSGAGGGVAAAVLAEAGREVFLLEEGAHVRAAQMNQREEQMYPLLYRDGGNQTTADGGISVLQGRALGGSTVINLADVVPIPDPVLAHWDRAFGVSRFGAQDVRAAAAEVKAVLGANKIPRTILNRNNQLLLQGGEALGVAGGIMEHNRVGCIGAGYCLLGCAYGAKRSVALTWIPRALETGNIQIQTDARVDRLESTGGRVTAVIGQIIDRATQTPIAPFRVEADAVVLAAGTIHSPLILAASKLGGRAVGRNLTLQPQSAVAALFPEPVVFWRGIPQATYLDGFEICSAEVGLGGYRLESVGSAPAMTPSLTSLPAIDLHAMMSEYPRFAACLCLVPDRPGGRVTRKRNGRPKITYRFQSEWIPRMRDAMRLAARVFLAAGAESVALPVAGARVVRSEADLDQLDRLPIRANTVPMISAHPQGTCRMAPADREGVVGLNLKVRGTKNLWVLDASIFPTSASTHTMIPVMSFALLGAREILS